MLPNKLDDKIVVELAQMIEDIKAGNSPTNPELDRAVRQVHHADAKEPVTETPVMSRKQEEPCNVCVTAYTCLSQGRCEAMQLRTTAMEEGYSAGLRFLFNNPYSHGTTEAAQWRLGLIKALEERA